MSTSRLVSIVIPAYKADYFPAALDSALRQNHDEIEIVICDDSSDDTIETIIDAKRAKSRWPIRYFRNEQSLGEIANVARCIAEAKGEYIKFLYDDDILVPDCVRILVDVLEHHADVALVTSYRKRIDSSGEFLPDSIVTRFPFSGDVILDGKELASFISEYPYNFIGEPSSAMCRRAAVLAFGGDLMSLLGKRMDWLGDVAIYLKLMQQGHLAMIARPLSYFRVSDQQYSQLARNDPARTADCYSSYYELTRKLGWVRESGNDTVNIAPLSDPKNFKPFELLAHFNRATGDANNVSSWLKKQVFSPNQKHLIEEHLSANDGGPSLLVVISDFDTQNHKVLTSLNSLIPSTAVLPRLEVAILSDRDQLPKNEIGARAQWHKTSAQEQPYALNHLLEQSSAEWIMLIDAGTEFTETGLICAELELLEASNCRAAFADELHKSPSGNLGLLLRPDLNLDYLLSFPLATARHWLFRRTEAVKAGGFDAGFPGALELELILRLIEQEGLTGIRHIEKPLLICPSPSLMQNPSELLALNKHLEKRGYPNGTVIESPNRHYHLKYGHADQPLVSILIPSKDQLHLLQRCIETVLEKTRYPFYEILIIDNGSETVEAIEWLAQMEAIGGQKIRVLRYPHPFNFSAMNNMAASEALGEYLILLNNDTAVLGADWIDELFNHALRPEVGIVGARLLFPNGTIQHAGVVLGVNGPANHVFIGNSMDSAGYMQRMLVDQNYSAVTAACMMIRRSLYEQVQGMDEVAHKVSYNDVDLCLKVGALGYLTVWTPHATLLHEGTVSQHKVDKTEVQLKAQRFTREQDALYAKWLGKLVKDPAYNSNLSLKGSGFDLEHNVGLTWKPLPWRPLPIVLVHSADNDNSVLGPLQTLRDAGIVDGVVTKTFLDVVELARFAPDVIVIQPPLSEEDLEHMRRMKAFSHAFKVLQITTAPTSPQAAEWLQSAAGYVDRVVVSTQALADSLRGLHESIRIAPAQPSAWSQVWLRD